MSFDFLMSSLSGTEKWPRIEDRFGGVFLENLDTIFSCKLFEKQSNKAKFVGVG